MKFKNINYAKVCAVISSGVLLVTGIQNIRYSEVRKLAIKIGNLKFDNTCDDPILNGVCTQLISHVNDAPNICRKYVSDEYSYKVHSYIPTLSSDEISFTFYDDYIEIDLLNDDEVYSRCFYNNDDSYSIMFNCESNFDDRLYTINYNFSSDGSLTSYVSYDGFFENTHDDLNSYSFVKTK